MNTVITPEALAKSKFRKVLMKDLRTADFDEAFLFLFPSPDLTNRANGDGDLLEIWDYWDRGPSSWVLTSRGEHSVNPETVIYVR